MLIDTHCHLTDEGLANQIDEVVKRAMDSGVEKILVPSVGIIDGRKAIEIASKFPNIWALVGVHPEILEDETSPNNRDEWLASEGNWIQKIKDLVDSSNKVVGIGEIGLDFHYDTEKNSKAIQMEIFAAQLSLARSLNLPVTIHMRDAEVEMEEVFRSMSELPNGQFHCWAGSEKMLELVLAKGFYVSFCGNITYKSAENLRDLIKKVPLDRLLLETDSPYLAPEGKRNSFNEPSNVKILAEYIAILLDLPVETLINQTTKNAECLYFPG